MSKFKVGDIVETILNGKDVISSVVAEITDTPDVWDYPDNYYRLRVLNSDSSYFDKGLCFDSHEKHLKLKSLKDKSHKKHMDLISDTHKQLNEIDNKQVLQTKPNNDFIYFKDLDMVFPKKIFQEDVLNIRLAQFEKDNNVINGFGVFLYSKKMLIKGFETKEQSQEFLKQLAELLGSDIL